jgi:hypothetical protein
MKKIAKNISGIVSHLLSQGLYFGLLIFTGTAFAETDFPKSREVYVLPIDIRDTSAELVQFTLHDLKFRIPKNHLSTILEQLRTQPDKIKDGFTMVGAGVGFAPKTEGNLGRFLAIPSESDLIKLSVRMFCREPDNTPNCSAPEGMLRHYEVFGKSRSFPDRFREDEVPSENKIPSIPDMDYIGYSVDSNGEPTSFLYADVANETIRSFAECSKSRVVDYYFCKFWFPWRDEYFHEFSIGEKYLSQYQEAYENALKKMESYIVTPHSPEVDDEGQVVHFPYKVQRVSQDTIDKAIGTHVYYFQLRENGDYGSAYAMFTDRQKGNVSLEAFSQHWESVRDKFGRLTHLRNTKVTWYRNPEGSPEGLYAAIDFRASFERLPVYCGFLVWSIDEGYKLQREEMKFWENKSGRPISNGEEEKAYAELSCR